MPRRRRIIVPGLPHHFTQRGNNRGDVFDTDADRAVFLDLLGKYAPQCGLTVMSYHFHLVARPASDASAAQTIGRMPSPRWNEIRAAQGWRRRRPITGGPARPREPG